MYCFWRSQLSGHVTPVVQLVSTRQAFAALTTAWHAEPALAPSVTRVDALASSPVRPSGCCAGAGGGKLEDACPARAPPLNLVRDIDSQNTARDVSCWRDGFHGF